jgi:hypothetical protein
MSNRTQIRIQPTPFTSIVVTTAGALLAVEVADAAGRDESRGETAARLRVIAHALMRYADSLDPLWIEDITPREATEPKP